MFKDKEKEEIEDDQKLYCPNCGSILKLYALTCERCGEKIPKHIWTENNSLNPGHSDNSEKENKNNSGNNDEQTVRLNISIPDSKRKEWKRLAANLGESVSELVREAMGALQAGLSGAESLEDFGERMEEWGKTLEKSLEESGITTIGEKIGKKVEKKVGKLGRKLEHKFEERKHTIEDAERLKKRVEGLIKLQKSLPIDKLAQALEISTKDAENIIYELAAEGIEGSLEEGIFKFTCDLEKVISKLNEIIDKM
jgi:hypothetical protein